MEVIEGGSILSAGGFRVGWSACGIKGDEGQPDVALIVSDGPASVAGVFTTNRFAAAPVEWDRTILPSENLRAVVVNSGNANACTGEQGRRDVRDAAALVAQLVGCTSQQVAVCSTGIIGRPLPMEQLREGIRAAHAVLSCEQPAARGAERAIMTTDTRPKALAVRTEVDGRAVCIGAMTKGSAMIAPNMATMLAFLTTDAWVPPAVLQHFLKQAADRSFNRITVDGDTSTNDSVLALASGACGAAVPESGPPADEFLQALFHVTGELAREIVRDGEGATRLVEVTVSGAHSEAEAERAARAIAESQLVKCAVHGGDPNWGRILCAAGYSGAQLDPQRVRLGIGEVVVFERGSPTGADASAEVAREEVRFHLDLGVGRAEASVWTCDLSVHYVEFNAHYHT